MKTRLLIILPILALCLPALTGENGPPDWEYGTFVYSVNIAGDDETVATLVGPAFPEGIRLLRDYKTLEQFKANLIVIVDALNASESTILLKAKRRLKR